MAHGMDRNPAQSGVVPGIVGRGWSVGACLVFAFLAWPVSALDRSSILPDRGSQACQWKPALAGLTLNSMPWTFAVWDDGNGEALYAGGSFTSAGGVTANRIARWNGSSWNALTGPSANGTSALVTALAVFDDGTGPALYAGGEFVSAGGITVNHVARWNGTRWHALSGPGGIGVNDYVATLAVFDDGNGPALYAGGRFSTAGGVSASSMARWNGNQWSALPTGGVTLNGTVKSMVATTVGGTTSLFVAGLFTHFGATPVNRVIRWDGQAWHPLQGPQGVGVEGGGIWTLIGHEHAGVNSLYAGGSLFFAGGVEARAVARWNGSRWWPLIGPSGNGLEVFGVNVEVFGRYSDGVETVLYTGGWFEFAGTLRVNRITRWNGSQWSTLAGTSSVGTNGPVTALAPFDDGIEEGPTLYVGGGFSSAGGLQATNIARWWCPTIEPPPVPVCVDLSIEGPLALQGTPRSPDAALGTGYTITASNTGGSAIDDMSLGAAISGLSEVSWSCTPSTACAPASGSGNVQTVMTLPTSTSRTVDIEAGVDMSAHFVEIHARALIPAGFEWQAGCRTRAVLIHPAGPAGVFKSGFE